MGNFYNISIKTNNKSHNIKMEKGVSFENEKYIYKIDNNGQLKKLDKTNNKWSNAMHIEMENSQWQIFQNVANNDNDAKTYSQNDIKKSLAMSNSVFTKDIKTNLKDYNIKNSNRNNDNNFFAVSVSQNNSQKIATLKFGITEKNDEPNSLLDKLENFIKNYIDKEKIATKQKSGTKTNSDLKPEIKEEIEEELIPKKGLSPEEVKKYNISPQGNNSKEVLDLAPYATIKINNEKKKARIKVDLATNVLYFYDKEGKPQNVYLVASGKKTPKTQTKTGVRSVSHVETYPYKEANPKTKRRKNPRAYGPKILILDYLNPKTGEITHGNGEFIHGNNNAKSLGQYASLGCIRMDNEVIKEISTLVDRHDIVVIYDSIKDSK